MIRGPLEVIIIFILVSGVLLLVRKSRRGTAKTTPQYARLQQQNTAELEESRAKKSVRRKRMRWLGIAIIIAGLIALGYVLYIVFDLVIVMCAAAILVILTGIVIVFLSMRR